MIVFSHAFVHEKVHFAFLAFQGVLGRVVHPAAGAGLRLPLHLGTALLGCLLAYLLHSVFLE